MVVPLLIERLQAGSPATTGVALLGISAMWAISAPLGGRLSDRLGRRWAGRGWGLACVTAIGLAMLAGGPAPGVTGTVIHGDPAGDRRVRIGLSGSPRQTAAMEIGRTGAGRDG